MIDNDHNVTSYIEDLRRENLIDDKHYLVWDCKFEDNFPAEAILSVLDEEVSGIASNIDICELKKYNSTKHDIVKSIKYCLNKKGIHFNFNDHKVSIAKKLASMVCKEIKESMMIGGAYDGFRTPKSNSFPQFVESLKRIAAEMKRESTEFYVITNKAKD